MAREQFANLPVTTLSGGINNSTTTVVVTDGSKMPLANFRIIIEQEIMFVTVRSSNTLTVIRAIESTSAASHADTTAVAAIITKGALDQIKLDVLHNALLPRATSLSADDDEFDDESFSGWTKVWNGSAGAITEVEQDHGLSLLQASGGSAGVHTGYMKAKTPSSGDWIKAGYVAFGNGGGYPHFQLAFSDGVTYGAGNQVFYGVSPNEAAHTLRSMTNWNNQTAFTTGGFSYYPTGMMHVMLKYKGSNTWDTFLSPDGIQWVQRESNYSMGSMTPTYMGFAITTWGGGPYIWNVKYVRFSF